MDTIVSNPGLHHLAEEVFWNLDVEDLKICAQINQSCNKILQNPMFCLRKFERLSKENRKDWIKVIQSVKNTDKGIAIISYLKWNFKKDVMVDLPCYSSPAVQDEFRMKILEICKKQDSSDEDAEIVKIFAPLTDNPNAPNNNGYTPIIWAACNGHTEIVTILAPFTDNPNAANEHGWTPIHEAAFLGHTKIVKLLAPLTDNPNAPTAFGSKPSDIAGNNTEIRRFLESFQHY